MTVPYPASGLTTVDALVQRQFFLGAGEDTYFNVVIEAGQVLTPGSVIGVKTATRKAVLCNATAGDGSQVPFGIVVDGVDATAADTEIAVLIRSQRDINANALVLHASWTLDAIKWAFVNNITLKTPIYSAI